MLRFKFIDKIPPSLRNKYILTILIFLIWIFLLDSNNLVARFKDMSELRSLRSDKEYYTNKIEVDKRKLRELKTDNDNLEKFAREQYHMKKADEDLYIVLTPHEDRKISRRNN
ncbi:MAG: septum formation initiator family protein [Bacteroidia bacterium]|nr:septum formation initiator family protein [Bacteroidia bacterium]